MRTLDLSRIVKQVAAAGPYRVIVDRRGSAMSAERARRDFGVVPTVVFIRADGWTIGAPPSLEAIAYKLWADEWIGFIRLPILSASPIDEYTPAVDPAAVLP